MKNEELRMENAEGTAAVTVFILNSSFFIPYNVVMYSPQVLDHFEHPRHVGDLENPTASAELSNPACGDVLRLSLRVVDGRVAQVRYKAKGCVPAIACGSALTELIGGRTIDEARALRRDQLVKYIGGLPSASLHASHLAMDALAAVLRQV